MSSYDNRNDYSRGPDVSLIYVEAPSAVLAPNMTPVPESGSFGVFAALSLIGFVALRRRRTVGAVA